MIVGCYVLHVYCDGDGCNRPKVHVAWREQHSGEYTGNTGRQARREAARAGWKLDDKNDKAYCRKCRKKD